MNQQENSGFTAVAIVTAVIGGIAIAGAGTTAAFGAVNAATRSDQSHVAEIDGVTELDVEAAADDVSIRFGDVNRAELQITGSDRNWRLERDEDTLILRGPDRWWGWGGDWPWIGSWGDDEQVDLVLPQELAGIDAELSLSAGSMGMEGEFGEVDIEVGAGSLSVAGSAVSLEAELSAGRADIALDGVNEASFGIAAGQLTAELTGSAPRDVQIEVSAGSLDLTLPDEQYEVEKDVGAGLLENDLQTAAGSRSSISVELVAGTVRLRPAD